MKSDLTIRLLGVRGSRPTHKRTLLGYGGNSTSFEIVVPDSDFHIFVDGGTGLAKRGRQLGQQTPNKKFHCLITHTHWDHILGFPFFEPIYSSENKFDFYASNPSGATFNQLFFGLQRQANLPVPPSHIKATINFHPLTAEHAFEIENQVKVTTYQLNHQGITLAYKFERGNSSVAIVTDHAPVDHGNYMGEGMKERASKDQEKFEREFNLGLINFLKDTNTVVFDTHFTNETLKPAWGHSTPQLALDTCKKAGVNRLILFHHAPEDSDRDVDDKVQSIFHDACYSGIEVEAAREEEEWDLCG